MSKATNTNTQTPIGKVGPWQKLRNAYSVKTPIIAKTIDIYLLFLFIMGISLLVYCIAIKGSWYRQFLAGFLACVGSFVMSANVRLQLDPINGKVPRKAILEFFIGNIVLHMLVANFIK